MQTGPALPDVWPKQSFNRIHHQEGLGQGILTVISGGGVRAWFCSLIQAETKEWSTEL